MILILEYLLWCALIFIYLFHVHEPSTQFFLFNALGERRHNNTGQLATEEDGYLPKLRLWCCWSKLKVDPVMSSGLPSSTSLDQVIKFTKLDSTLKI